MITLISGTNRPKSRTLQVANHYRTVLDRLGVEYNFITFEDWNFFQQPELFKQYQETIFIPTQKFIFITPEYNGSIPGIFKLWIDSSDIRRVFWYKKALLVGVADGRAGNLRGLDHLSGILQYLRMHVHWNKLPISRINEEMDQEGNFLNANTQAVIEDQIKQYLVF